ncbi:3-deoxy-D-manno-octulosonic acid transferase [Rhodoferax sp.]|uniref:3-deoxy-D-manno-octulosonic acid transferase n=1 Tax=Rhodoferax sp. TaxID=50421 RepID=UPI002ACDC3F7|nr:3-deoxy-D-manno-octulosonic acid transferase [Rhodoferax sp.]MDZ7919995.1 3-deoxy-D-manno-octulosonic acid transferase [Rhodoferax sp.]
MMRALYSLAVWLAQPLVRRKLRRRAAAEPLYGEHIAERFGHYAHGAPAAGEGPLVWLHAVSLGETLAAATLVAALRQQLPGMRLLLTHGTATGRAAGVRLLQPGDVQVWQPWDTVGAVRRFLTHFRPQLGLLMETELWPNLVAESARAGVPLCLVNARLSEKSLRQAQRLAWLARPAYQGLNAVWAQSEADAQRLRQLGAPVRGVMGNFKFDMAPNATQLAQGRAWRTASTRPVLMFASAREGEEAMLVEVLKRNRPLGPVDIAQEAPEIIANSVQWLVVPRHPQRFDEVAALFTVAGYTVARRSQWGADGPVAADVWLGDSLGEMALYFGLAHAALLGGSFAPLGGQNLIEAAACGVPVFMGPHTYNFAEAAQLSAASGAAVSCADLVTAVDRATTMLHQPQALDAAHQAALGLGAAHRGAAQRTAQALATVLAEKKP